MFRRPVTLIAAILSVLVIVGLLVIGAFPPRVSPVPVERTLPNDRFQPR
jgi:hypothetical protein